MRATSYRNNGNPFTDLLLHLDRDTFLKSRKINASLKAELADKSDDDLNVLQMMMETARPLTRANGRLLAILHPDLRAVCEAVVEFDDLFDGKEGTRGLIHQLSPKLEPPFHAGFNPWSEQVFRFARYYTTEDWTRSDDEEDKDVSA